MRNKLMTTRQRCRAKAHNFNNVDTMTTSQDGVLVVLQNQSSDDKF